MTSRDRARRLCHLALSATIVFVASQVGAESSGLDRQRALFIELHPVVERGDWSAVDALPADDRKLLRDYVLWPDLRSTWLRATISVAEHDEIEAFLDRYGTLKPARELRYRYALHLAKEGDLNGFLSIYERYYQGIEMAKLDCLALRAEIKNGREQRVVNRAVDLWLVGRSQVEECDPVFAWIRDNDKLGAIEYRKRFDLAIEAREFRLARWLGREIGEPHVDIASQWLKAQQNPEQFVAQRSTTRTDRIGRDQLAYAIERLTYADPVRAAGLWSGLRQKHDFPEEQRLTTERHIALWLARDNLPGAYRALAELPAGAQDDEVARWRARVSLRAGEWTTLLEDVAMLTPTERQSEEWRYWHAYALGRTGDGEAARSALRVLAAERSYYGFLAADALGANYEFDHSELVADEGVIAALAARPQIIRARELFKVGLDSKGRSEWDTVVRYLDDADKNQAAILAYRWGWHSRAIATAAQTGEYDDLHLRYPLAFQDEFESSSQQASIPANWAYGVARSESLFMRDVRSHAGAIGLMQLMPATGRQVARELRLPYAGVATLTNPEDNIRLGTTYLGQMAERYGGNRVLATAAYNAGPHRVDKWLPDEGSLDARIWIENIPYNETRKYVRRVLAAETIFHWRMTGEFRRLSEQLQPVVAAEEPQQLARR